jgi:hypothetical protein
VPATMAARPGDRYQKSSRRVAHRMSSGRQTLGSSGFSNRNTIPRMIRRPCLTGRNPTVTIGSAPMFEKSASRATARDETLMMRASSFLPVAVVNDVAVRRGTKRLAALVSVPGSSGGEGGFKTGFLASLSSGENVEPALICRIDVLGPPRATSRDFAALNMI